MKEFTLTGAIIYIDTDGHMINNSIVDETNFKYSTTYLSEETEREAGVYGWLKDGFKNFNRIKHSLTILTGKKVGLLIAAELTVREYYGNNFNYIYTRYIQYNELEEEKPITIRWVREIIKDMSIKGVFKDGAYEAQIVGEWLGKVAIKGIPDNTPEYIKRRLSIIKKEYLEPIVEEAEHDFNTYENSAIDYRIIKKDKETV